MNLTDFKPLRVHTEPQAKMFERQDKESGKPRKWAVGNEYWMVYHEGGLTRVKAGDN